MILRNEGELEEILSTNESIKQFVSKIFSYVDLSASPQEVLTNTLKILKHFKVEDIKNWDDISENESFFNLIKEYLAHHKGDFVMNPAAVVGFWTIFINKEKIDADYLIDNFSWEKDNANYFVIKLKGNN